ncbi:hypothetical protein Bca4012_031250 [Brassica carinata]
MILCSIAASNSQPPSSHRRKLLPRRPDPKWIHRSRNPRGAAYFISSVMDSSSVSCYLVSKVGEKTTSFERG